MNVLFTNWQVDEKLCDDFDLVVRVDDVIKKLDQSFIASDFDQFKLNQAIYASMKSVLSFDNYEDASSYFAVDGITALSFVTRIRRFVGDSYIVSRFEQDGVTQYWSDLI